MKTIRPLRLLHKMTPQNTLLLCSSSRGVHVGNARCANESQSYDGTGKTNVSSTTHNISDADIISETNVASEHDVTEKSANSDYYVNPEFHNRNPRNLESSGFAKKRVGWIYQSPRQDYYNKLIFEKTNYNTTGRVEHFSGKTVVSASTSEWAIQKHLYSCLDMSAAENVGRVLADRCLKCGITHVFYDEQPNDASSQSLQAFLTSLREGQICLKEPKWATAEYEPGIDYDKPNRYAEKKEWKDDYQVS